MSQREIRVGSRGLWPHSAPTRLAVAIGGLLAAGAAAAVEWHSYEWLLASPGYVAAAQNCRRASQQGAPPPQSDPCSFPDDWYDANLKDHKGPILVWNGYDLDRNHYYNWVNGLSAGQDGVGYSFRIRSVTLSADGSVGTNGAGGSTQNNLGIGNGYGMTATWELSSRSNAATIEGARVEIKTSSGPGLLEAWGLVGDASKLLVIGNPDATWLQTSGSGSLPDSNQIPTSASITGTTFNSPYASDDEVNGVIAKGQTVRIQFYQEDGTESWESPSAVLSDATVLFSFDTANVAATGEEVYSRVGAPKKPTDSRVGVATVEVTNIPLNPVDHPGLTANGVKAGALDGKVASGYFKGDGTTDVGGWVIAPGDPAKTVDYDLIVPEFTKYYGSTEGKVVVDTGDAPGRDPEHDPGDLTVDATLNGNAVGPRAEVSGYGGVDKEAVLYASGMETIHVDLEDSNASGYYRDLTFSNIFGEIASLASDFTDLTLGLSTDSSTWIRLFELDADHKEIREVEAGQNSTVIHAKGPTGPGRLFRFYLTGGHTSGNLLLGTDMYRDLGATNLVPSTLNKAWAFSFDLAANGPVPVPATILLVGLGLAGLGIRRRR